MHSNLRRKTLTFDRACSLLSEAESLLEGSEFEVDSLAVLELVRDSDCSAYDCEFVALAIKLDTLRYCRACLSHLEKLSIAMAEL